jgi:hypothetical protein
MLSNDKRTLPLLSALPTMNALHLSKLHSSTISSKQSNKLKASWNKKNNELKTESLNFFQEKRLTDYTHGLSTQT